MEPTVEQVKVDLQKLKEFRNVIWQMERGWEVSVLHRIELCKVRHAIAAAEDRIEAYYIKIDGLWV